VVLKYDVPILYIETKNIGVSLDKLEKAKRQLWLLLVIHHILENQVTNTTKGIMFTNSSLQVRNSKKKTVHPDNEYLRVAK